MSRRWFKDQFDERMKDEAAARTKALKEITAICHERTPDAGEVLGITEGEVDKLLIIRIKDIIEGLA